MTDVGVLVTLDAETLKNRVFLDYTSRDFTAIRAQLVGMAKGMMPGWGTVGESSDFGTLLIELFAAASDIMNFYIDRTASEAFLATAVRQQSVLYMADMMGYSPIGQSAASVSLKFTAPVAAPEATLDPITIRAGTQVYSGTGTGNDVTVIFETVSDLTLVPSLTEEVEGTVTAEEGMTVKDYQLGESAGQPNAEFVIPHKGVIAGSVRIITAEGYDSIVWDYTSHLAASRPTQAMFTTYIDDQNFTHIVFGDNSSGRIPSLGAKVFCSYRYGVGAAANGVPAGDLTTIIPVGFEEWEVICTNPEQPVGGADPESVMSMKYSIPRAAARIRSRAVTLNDYADLAMQVPGVVKSMAEGTVYTAVHIHIGPSLPSYGGDLSPEAMQRLCRRVEQYMADKILIGSQVIAEPATTQELWLNLFVRITIHVSEVYNRSSVRKAVEKVVKDILSYDAMDFGTRISLGKIYRAVLTVAGVEWAEIRWLSTNPAPFMSAPGIENQAASGLPLSPTATIASGIWKLDSTNAAGEPATTTYRIADNPGEADVDFVILRLSNKDTTPPAVVPGPDKTSQLSQIAIGDHIVMNTTGDGASWWDYIVEENVTTFAGAGTPLTPGYVSIPVLLARQSDPAIAPIVGRSVSFSVVRYAPTPVSAGEVGDVETPQNKIPRLDQTVVVEPEENWPDWTADERTHHGLWVIADGGLANT